MALKRSDKEAIIADVNSQASEALSAVVADYRGLTVSEMTELRKQAREQSVYLKVVRNTLMKRAVSGTEFECLDASFVGPTLVAFSMEDPGAGARIFKEFAKDHDALEVRSLAVGGREYGPGDIDVLASLPTRDQALATLMQLLLEPVTQLVRGLNEVPTKVVRAISAVGDKKSESA